MTMIDDKIRAAIKVECDRQYVDEDRQQMLYDAYDITRFMSRLPLTKTLLFARAVEIEPDNKGQFRTTPVTFNGTVGGVAPDNIPRAMMIWINSFNEMLNGRFEHREWASVENIDLTIKEFLDIHPFSDGNGRTAWLLRVWLLNQWDDPQPLPNYYGE